MLVTHGIQSALNPKSPYAETVATFSWMLFAGAAVVTLVVVAFAAWALWARPERRRWMSGTRFVILAGVVFPAVTLSTLLLYSFGVTRANEGRGEPAAVRIEVVGHQWWWRVIYRDGAGAAVLETANEIRIPVGEPVELVLRSEDVLHSFWVPVLAGKLDMIPGHVNRLRLRASQEGVFRGQCAEYCGGPHAQMAFYVVAQAPETYAQWLAAQREPAAAPTDAFASRGRDLFMQRCAACHAIRGTPAAGRLGPDLTHIADRTSLGAGILPNTPGNLAGWISSSQHIKPGNLMPSMNIFSGEELRALTAYLTALR